VEQTWSVQTTPVVVSSESGTGCHTLCSVTSRGREVAQAVATFHAAGVRRHGRCCASWVEKLPSGRYRARYRAEDGRQHSKSFPTKGAAKAFLQTVGADMQRGQWVDPRGGQMLFRDWVAVWAAARVVRLTTRNADEGRIRNHLLPAFGRLQLKDITPMGVRSFTARLAERRAPATVRHCHALLSPMLASRNGSTACELGVPPRSVQSRGVG
jgi:hypothetical protein